ncbi:MAG: protein kinase, partial [Planctomycetota bacterium]
MDPNQQLDSSDPGLDAVDRIVDEWLGARRRGSAPEIEELIRAHPDHAKELRGVLPTIVFLDQARESSFPPAATGVPVAFGDYRLLREVGRGGMGVVYEAEQLSLLRRVAVKVLASHHATDSSRERFHREAHAVARLEHPNIVPVYAIGETGGVPFMAMKFIEGRSLADVIAAGGKGLLDDSTSDGREDGTRSRVPSRYQRVAALGRDVARALASAHELGVLHRDIKPGNLLLDTELKVWVADFGLAKVEQAADITVSGALVGTPRYMAPEAIRGWADPRADIYGVGVTLYELLTGHPAFESGSQVELLRDIQDREPVRPRRRDPRLPRDLETIVLKAMEKDPERRYPTARALASDLDRFLAGEVIDARPASLTYRLGRFAQRHVLAVAGTTTALLVVFLMALGWSWSLDQERRDAIAARDHADQEAYAAKVNLLGAKLWEGQNSVAVALASVLDQHPGSWEHRYLTARLDPWLWSTTLAGSVQGVEVLAHGTGTILVLTNTGHVVGLDPRDGHVLAQRQTHAPWTRTISKNAFVLDPAASVLLSSAPDGEVVLADAASLAPLRSLRIPDVQHACYRPLQRDFVVVTRKSVVRVSLDAEPETVAQLPTPPRRVAVDGSGLHALVVADAQRTQTPCQWVEMLTGEVRGVSGFEDLIERIPGTDRALTVFNDIQQDLHCAVIGDMQSGAVAERFVAPEQLRGELAVSPDGQRAAVIPMYSSRVYGLELCANGRLSLVGAHEGSWVGSAKFVDANTLITGSTDGTVRAWDPRRKLGVLKVVETDAYFSQPVVDERRRRVGVPDGTNKLVYWYDLSDGRCVARWDLASLVGAPAQTVLLDDGERAVTLSNRGELVVHEAASGRLERVLREQAGPPANFPMRFDASADGRWLAAPTRHGSVIVWNAQELTQHRELRRDGPQPGGVAFSPDARLLAVVYGEERDPGACVWWDVESSRPIGPIETFAHGLKALAYDPTGRSVAVGGFDGEGCVIDVVTRKRVALLGVGTDAGLSSPTFTPDGTRLLGQANPREIVVWNPLTGHRILSVPGPDRTWGTAWLTLAADGTLVAAGGRRVEIHP